MAISHNFCCSRLFVIFLASTSLYFSGNTLGNLYESVLSSNLTTGVNFGEISSKNQYFCPWNYVRHLVCINRGKGYFSSRVNYDSNSISSFNHIRLIVSGDINLHPGPDKCSVCAKTIAVNHRALSCDHCGDWCHIKCGNV